MVCHHGTTRIMFVPMVPWKRNHICLHGSMETAFHSTILSIQLQGFPSAEEAEGEEW